MNRKYITTQILLACKSKPQTTSKDIHARLRETIAEHERMVERWEQSWKIITAKEVIMNTTKAA